MACDNCKEPIYLNESSIIQSPSCNDSCPEEVNCNGEITYTDCVSSTVALPCIGTEIGATQTTVNQAINTALCSIGNSCDTWYNIPYLNKWKDARGFIPYQVGQYSNVRNCIVSLRGIAINTLPSGCTNSIITQLPVGKRPLSVRVFSVNIVHYTNECAVYFPGWITIDTSGNVTLSFYPTYNAQTYLVSLDSIKFEVN